MITKPTIIISSLGRTGTTFFAEFFKENSKNTYVVHEPENIYIKKMKIKDVLWGIENFGFSNIILKKITKKWGILSASNKKLLKKQTNQEVIEDLIKQREDFVEKQKEGVYIESNHHYFGVLDLLPSVFKNLRIIYLIRDPRDWVRSWINFQGWYHWTDINNALGNRLSPKTLGDEEELKKWKKYGRFEKLCWAWNYMNSKAIENIKDKPNCKILRYEDVFINNTKYDNLEKIINFATDFKGVEVELKDGYKKSLDKKIHNKPKSYSFPHWKDWNKKRAVHLNEVCGDLMKTFNYGKEDAWLKKIN